MKSSSGTHFIALDHIRAFAAFMVFAWHFLHCGPNFPIPQEYTPSLLAFPLALLDEGHTGVALFMTLSGYLFAKLLDGRSIDYGAFLWNRAVRLLPLLTLVMIAAGFVHGTPDGIPAYLRSLARGVLRPSLPNGGWSITTEFHFYALLPFLLLLLRRSSLLPLVILIASIALRYTLLERWGQVQSASYYTIIGRIDQFVLGMVICRFRGFFAGRHLTAAATFAGFALYYWWFDGIGGFFHNPTYPSPSRIWVLMPTIEAVTFAILIAWYDQSFAPPTTGISGFLGRLGEYSYSIYLLHFFVLHYFVKLGVQAWVNERVVDLTNFYLACLSALVAYLLMMPIGYLSFRLFEAPFLRFRKRYIVNPSPRGGIPSSKPSFEPQLFNASGSFSPIPGD